MFHVDTEEKKIHCKIVYYGPGMGGKSTNLRQINEQVCDKKKGKFVALSSDEARTVFFDYLPLSLGKLNGYDIQFQLYSVPGQIFYDSSRQLLLNGVHGLVFVADSRKERMNANWESFENMKTNLLLMGMSLNSVPTIIQFNQRDRADATSVSYMKRSLGAMNLPHFEAVARDGVGVYETFRAIGSACLLNKSSSS